SRIDRLTDQDVSSRHVVGRVPLREPGFADASHVRDHHRITRLRQPFDPGGDALAIVRISQRQHDAAWRRLARRRDAMYRETDPRFRREPLAMLLAAQRFRGRYFGWQRAERQFPQLGEAGCFPTLEIV